MRLSREYSGFPFWRECVTMGKLRERGTAGMECVIFCAAEFDRLARPLGKDAWVIAADGGNHAQRDYRGF